MSKVIGSSNCEDLINILYNLVGPMLGCHDCVKCISQTDTDVYTADVVTLLSSLEIEPACVELLIESLQSHKWQYKRGTKSLLFMIARLAKSVFLLEQWGIPTAFAIKVIQKNILELTKSVEQLVRVVSVDHILENPVLNRKGFFPIPSYKKDKLNESECTNQYQNLSSNGFAFKKQTTYSHSKEETLDFRLESEVELQNVKSEKNLASSFAGEISSCDLNTSEKCTVKQLQTEDFNRDAVDWFFEGACQSTKEDYQVFQPLHQETVDYSSEINRLVPQEIKEHLPLNVREHARVISKTEPVVERNSSLVIHGGTNLFSMDIKIASSHNPAHINSQKVENQHTSSTLSAAPVDKYSHCVSLLPSPYEKSKSEPLDSHKILPKSFTAAEKNVLGHHLSLSSLNQMLNMVGKPKLKMDISSSSRHLRPNFDSECFKQDFLAHHDIPVDSSHKGKDCKILESYSEKSLRKSDCNQNGSCQTHFPDELCYLDTCHLEMMDIVKQVYVGQITATKEKGFNPNLVDCFHVPVSLSNSKKTFLTATTASVFQGLILACKSADLTLCNLKGDLLTLLVNADLTPSYHHIGYKPSLSKTTLVSTLSDMDKTSDGLAWERKIIQVVKSLKVSLILVRGQTNEKLINMCSEIGIYILTNIPLKTMSVMADYLRVNILTYMEQSSPANVCTLSLEPVAEVWVEQLAARKKNTGELFFHVSNIPVVQTVLMSSSCAMSSQLVEERFWKCLHSVSNALSDGKILPGAGETEKWCADKLRNKSAILLTQSSMESVVVESLSDVFMDFSDRVKINSLLTSGASPFAINSFHSERKSSDLDSTMFSTAKHAYSFSSEGLSKPETELAKDFVAIDHLTCALDKKVSDAFCDTLGKKPIQFDNYQSKLALWKTAVDVVCMLISIGSSVLTGVSSEMADF